MLKFPPIGELIGLTVGYSVLVNFSVAGSKRTMLCAQFSEAQTTSFLSTCSQCVPGSAPAGVGGTEYSVIIPLRGSSFPMYGVRWLVYQMLPLESLATS